MAQVGMDGIWELVDVLKTPGGSSEGATYATVTRIDNEGTVWVHIPGGAEETPANGLNVATVKPGDVVSLSIGGNQANVLGNATAPAVSDREVAQAVEPALDAANEAAQAADEASEVATAAQSMAQAAQAVAEATGQHFWDADDGAHITEVTRDEWNDATSENYHSGANSLWNSLGMLFRKGLNNLLAIVTGDSPGLAIYDGEGNAASNVVARFSSDGVQIGRDGSAGIEINSSNVVFDGEDGTPIMTVGVQENEYVNWTAINTVNDYMHIGHDMTSDYYGSTVHIQRSAYEDDDGYTHDYSRACMETNASRMQARVETDASYYDDSAAAALYAVKQITGTENIPFAQVICTATETGTSQVVIGSSGRIQLTSQGQINGTATSYNLSVAAHIFRLTGAGNIRVDDSSGNAEGYFIKYLIDNSRTQLHNRGCYIWQTTTNNVHLADGSTDSNSTWEYSFEAGGLYRRTKSGSTWSGWAKLG